MNDIDIDENVYRVECGGKELILVATAHVSKQSVELVKRVIDEERPDSVCVELDEGRYQNIQNPKAWESTDLVKVIKSGKVGFMLANLALSSYQKKMAQKLDAVVGGEMLQGIESAKEVGAQLVLADRDIQTTFLRIWRKLGFIEKIKLIFGLIFSIGEDEDVDDEDLQAMLQGDVLEAAMGDLKKQFPKVGDILIHERDQYLANKIRNAPGNKVVAVLGGAHVPGIRDELFREQDMEAISEVPPAKPTAKIIAWAIPIAIVVLIIVSFAQSVQTGLQQLSSWVLWNGILAAVFTALALGHPLSILTSFVVAPISSLNPMLACGWFAGLVEATLKKPTVQDLQNIPTDIFSLKGFFSNRFLKALIVVVMANIGSSIGTFVAGTDMIRNLL